MSDNPIDAALGLRPLEEALSSDSSDAEDSDQSDDQGGALEVRTDAVPVTTSTDDSDAINPHDDETYNDIEQARSNIQNIITQGDVSLKEMIELAKQSESPRAFEVASTMMKTLLDANKDFVDMSMKKKYHKEELLGPKEEAHSETNITNNNLIMSTTDIIKMLKGEID